MNGCAGTAGSPEPTDHDEQWALIGAFLQAWRSTRVSVAGRHGEHDLREVVNAILYQNRTGCQWAYLPHDLPQSPRPTTTSAVA